MATAAEYLENENATQGKEGPRNLTEAVATVIGKLEREVEDRIGKREPIERRWLEDLRQFHGKYDESIDKDLKAGKKSRVFLNQTRPKTNAMEARLSDMLFPTDDKNWGIGPTPVPELTVGAEQAALDAATAATLLSSDPQNQQLQQQKSAADEALSKIKAQQDEARKRARGMEEEMDDQLTECEYGSQARDAIRNACRIGSGIMKGPVTDGKTKRNWKRDDTGAYQIVYGKDERPSFWNVDPWGYFPDLNKQNPRDGQGDFERHLLNAKQMRALARLPGFDPAAIRQVLLLHPTKVAPQYLNDIRAITSEYATTLDELYQVFEYHGPVTAEDMMTLVQLPAFAAYREDVEALRDPATNEIDPLEELNVVVWFCQGQPLKVGIHPLDSNDCLYSVFCLEKDDAGPFGFGIPYIMRDDQKSIAAAWRTTLDNMGLSSGPQIVINDEVIEPENGEWVLEPRKIWRRKTAAPKDQKPFETFDIPSHLEELLPFIEMCKKNTDEGTALPMIAQGDQSSQITKTLGGMSILMNSVNVVFRRIVKNWDDDMTTPNIRRLYDWNMQFNPKDHIKGDYQVDARGTSVLLVREMQSANIMAFLAQFAGHPILGKYLRKGGLQLLRRLAQVLMIPQDEAIKTDDEVAQDEAAAASKPQPPPPDVQKILAQLNIAKQANESRERIAVLEYEKALIMFAGQANMKKEELMALLEKARIDTQSKERIFAAEAAIDAAQPKDEDGGGSGGYFS